MKGEWCYFKSYFSKDYCNSIIEKSKDFNFQEANLGDNGLTINDGYRKSRVTWIYPNDFPQLYDDLWKLQLIANRDWFGFHVDNLEYIQLSEYNESNQGEYKKHQDVFYINNSTRHRKLSAVIQLSDSVEYCGGDLKLFNCNEYPDSNEIREQGTVIFFPSFVFHQVDPVILGKRNSLVAWFEGPKWR